MIINRCITSYKIVGSNEAITNLWSTLESMSVNKDNVMLANLAQHYNIDYEGEGIDVRGYIYKAEDNSDVDNDYYQLSIETDTADYACDELFDAIKEALENEISISYRELVPGCLKFFVHDEGNFFPEECVVLSSGEPFEEWEGKLFGTIEEAIQEWCSKMGVERGELPQGEEVDYINEYEYDDLYFDTYYRIKPYESV